MIKLLVNADQAREDTHSRDKPKRTVAGHRKGKTDDVGFTGSPIPIKDRCGAFPVNIAQTLGISGYDRLVSFW